MVLKISACVITYLLACLTCCLTGSSLVTNWLVRGRSSGHGSIAGSRQICFDRVPMSVGGWRSWVVASLAREDMQIQLITASKWLYSADECDLRLTPTPAAGLRPWPLTLWLANCFRAINHIAVLSGSGPILVAIAILCKVTWPVYCAT